MLLPTFSIRKLAKIVASNNMIFDYCCFLIHKSITS